MSPPPPAAVWKPPPNGHPKYPGGGGGETARLSPDSGRGSDRTGSDTSNSYSDKSEAAHQGGANLAKNPSHLPPPPNSSKQFSNNPHPSSMHHPQQQQQQYFPAPAYRSVYGPLILIMVVKSATHIMFEGEVASLACSFYGNEFVA